MSKSPSEEGDIPPLFHIGTSVERHSSVVDRAWDAHQKRPGSIPPRAGFLSVALPESSLLGTSIDLHRALTLLLSRMDKMKSNIANQAEEIRDQAEAMSTGKYSLVPGLFNQNSPVPKTSGHLSSHSPSQGVKAVHSSSSKRRLDDGNDLNVGNEIIDQIVTE